MSWVKKKKKKFKGRVGDTKDPDTGSLMTSIKRKIHYKCKTEQGVKQGADAERR